MYKKVIQYCKEKGMPISAFEKMCGLANGTVNGWKNHGGGNPRGETIKKISENTGISIEKWMYGWKEDD